MSTTTDVRSTLTALVNAHLATRAVPTEYVPEDNPYAGATVADLHHGVGLNMQDRAPARNLAPSGSIGSDLEQSRFTGLAQGSADRSKQRAHAAAQRRQRAAAFDAMGSANVPVSPERLKDAWLIVAALMPILTRIVRSKRVYAERLLGHLADDVLGGVSLSMAIALAKSTEDLGEDGLLKSALQLAQMIERDGAIPGEQVDKVTKRQRKQVAKGRKLLMGIANNRVKHTITDMYRQEQNLRWDSLDIIDTVMATINGPGDDPTHAHSKASRVPSMVGTRFTAPGSLDPHLLATSINAAISARGLDPLVEVLLGVRTKADGTTVPVIRTDGAVEWSANAERIILAAPHDGRWIWDLTIQATQHLANARNEQGKAAMRLTRELFAWLPGLIGDLIRAHDAEVTRWNDTGHGFLPSLASVFDGYLAAEDVMGARRYPLAPSPTFTAPQAIDAIVSILAGDA